MKEEKMKRARDIYIYTSIVNDPLKGRGGKASITTAVACETQRKGEKSGKERREEWRGRKEGGIEGGEEKMR